MEDMIYFTSDLTVTKNHILWVLTLGTPVKRMHNAARAVNGEQGGPGIGPESRTLDASLEGWQLC